MAIKNLDKTGLGRVWANIKSYIASKVPTKTSQLTNDSGFLTSHQSLNNYVDLTSNQILTGAKRFTGSGIYNANLVKGTLPTATSYINLAMSGSNAYTSSVHRMGLLESAIDTAGTVSTYISAYKFELNSKVAAAIGVRYPLNSTPYAYAPNPDDGTSGQKIATTNWVESKKYLTSHQSLSGYVKGTIQANITAKSDLGWTTSNTDNLVRMGNIAYWNGAYSGTSSNLAYCVKGAFGDMATKTASNYVTTSTDQTISGKKTLTAIVYTQPTTTSGDAYHQHIMYTDTEKGTLPTRNYYKHVEVVDSTKSSVVAHRLSAVRVGAQTSGNTYAEFNVYKTKEAGSTRTSLGIRYDYAKDTWVTYSPTPPSTDNSTQIATTAWVTAKKYLTSHQDISGKQDKISTYVSNLVKSGNTLFIYTNSNTNSPSGSISLNTTISDDVGTTVTTYYISSSATTLTGTYSANNEVTSTSSTPSVSAGPDTIDIDFGTPKVGSIYSGNYLYNNNGTAECIYKDAVTIVTIGGTTTRYNIKIERTGTLTLPTSGYNTSNKYLCTSANNAHFKGTLPKITYTKSGTFNGEGTINGFSGSKSTFLRVE